MTSQLDELSLSAHLFAGSAKMEDDGFDPLAHEDDYVGTQAWQSQTQHAGTSCGRGGFDLNSQASASEGFPGLREYENFLQSSDVDLNLNPARGHTSMAPPPLRAPAPTLTMPTSARHLNKVAGHKKSSCKGS